MGNKNARLKLLQYIEDRQLVDPYRELYPDSKRFTWRRTNPLQQARLDFYLTTSDLLTYTYDTNIGLSYNSDHSPVILYFKFEDNEHGKGLCKFNNSLLYDPQYVEQVNNVISNTKRQYAVPVYTMDDINNIPDSELHLSINDNLFLETLLMNIRGETISYATLKKKKKQRQGN